MVWSGHMELSASTATVALVYFEEIYPQGVGVQTFR